MADTPELVGGPPAVDQSGNLTIWWVPAIEDPTLPTLTEISAGTRITYSFLPDGWSLTAPQDKNDDDRLTSPQTPQALGKVKPALDDLKYVDSADPGSAAVVLALTGKDTSKDGFFVERRNVPQTNALAVDDLVRVVQCSIGIQAPGPATGDGKFSLVQGVAVHALIGPVSVVTG